MNDPDADARPVTIEVEVRLQALAIPEPDGGYSVLIPALGCSTVGETVEDAAANVVEAVEAWLESQHDLRKDKGLKAIEE